VKVIINAASIFKGGAEQVAHSFITECMDHPQHTYHVFLRENIGAQLNKTHFPENFTFYEIPFRPGSSIFHVRKAIRYFNRLAKKIQPDVVISTGGHGFWKPDIPVVGGFNIPHYVYPESPYFNSLNAKQKMYWSLKMQFDLFFYRRLDAVVVQTEDVKQRLEKFVKQSPVYSVSNTVNSTFFRNDFGKSRLPDKKPDEFRLLTVSSDYPHKNLSVIIETIRELRKKNLNHIRFVTTLPGEAFKKFEDAGVSDTMINVEPVPIHDCPALYRDCDAMFLPTLLECFSASYAEAMKMERPILTSDLGFAHTVCKDAALYFDPLDPEDIAQSIDRVVGEASLREKLVEEGKKEFKKLKTPAERAGIFLQIAESLVKRKEIEV
jgi:glycosyltransferase involved in cell wall biosynthesis